MRDRSDNKRKAIIGVLALVLAVACLALVMHLIEERGLLDEQFGDSGNWGSDNEVQLDLNGKLYSTTDNIDTYLLLGLDRGGEDMGEGYNGELADFQTMLIVDNTTKKYGFLQFDRNTMVEMTVPNYIDPEAGDETAVQQLCIAHWYGRTPEERNENAVAAIATLTGGLEADNYYVLNMADIGKVNDAIGGVTVTIDTDMTDVDPAFTAGSTVKLTGEQAEKFVRARKDVSDGTNKSRMSRQTQYMQSAYEIVYGHITEDPEYVNSLTEKLENVIQAGDNPDKLSKLTNQIVTYESAGILKPEGEVKTEKTREGDDKEYEAFYMDQGSLVSCLQKIIDLKEMAADEEE